MFETLWLLTTRQMGVAAIPPSEFMTDANVDIISDFMRFAVCKPDDVLEDAKVRLRGLKKYIQN